MWASDRWDRLAAGFRSEGALLLAYVPPQALTILALKPDGIVVLAPGGYDPEGDPSPGMKRLRDVGTPILATVVDDEVDEPDREGTASRPRHPRSSIGHRTRRDRQRRTSPWQWILAIAAVVLVATVLLIPDRPPAEDPERPAGAGDSLYYAIQVASFDAVGRALEFLSGLERRELTGTVTPIRLGAQGIWHRVILGLFPSRAAADSALRALWASGAIEDGHGSVLRAPHALDLGTRPSADSARAEALALRERGVAAYVVRAPAGARVLVGAFEEPDQAGVAESLLTAAELRSTIAPRTGRSP